MKVSPILPTIKILQRRYGPTVKGKLDDPVIVELAKKHDRDPAQILIWWLPQRYLSIGLNLALIHSNAKGVYFELPEDRSSLDDLDCGKEGSIHSSNRQDEEEPSITFLDRTVNLEIYRGGCHPITEVDLIAMSIFTKQRAPHLSYSFWQNGRPSHRRARKKTIFANTAKFVYNFVRLLKSATRSRTHSNAKVFDFELLEEDMRALNDLDRGKEGSISWNPVDAEWLLGPITEIQNVWMWLLGFMMEVKGNLSILTQQRAPPPVELTV
ncbi:hypothetical protein B0H34DRAFT_672886 [Crassisporium funariophilum]|nr:hypothetical protein B0H34DRAFT_672886 [Crassisporium funariophilum]